MSDPGRPLRVLVADDQSDVRAVLRRVLSRELPVDVCECGSGLDAIQQVHAQAFDLLILDIEMGPVDGFDVLDTLQGETVSSGIPVIVVTGAASVERVERLRALGVLDVVAKPLSYTVLKDRLIPLVARLVGRRSHSVSTPAGNSPLIQPDNPVWLIGQDTAAWDQLCEQLHGVCPVRLWSNPADAIRAAQTDSTGLVLLSAAQPPPFSPVLVARGLRRASARTPVIVLTGTYGIHPLESSPVFDAVVAPENEITLERVLSLVRSTMSLEGRAQWLLRADELTGAAIAEAMLATMERVTGPLRSLRKPLIVVGEPVTEASAVVCIGKHEWRIALCVTPPVAVTYAALRTGDTELVSHSDALAAVSDLLTCCVWPRLESFLASHDVHARIARPGMRTVPWERSLVNQPVATCAHYFCVGAHQLVAALALIPPVRDPSPVMHRGRPGGVR